MGGLGRNLLKFLTFLILDIFTDQYLILSYRTIRVSWRGAANCDAMEEENI